MSLLNFRLVSYMLLIQSWSGVKWSVDNLFWCNRHVSQRSISAKAEYVDFTLFTQTGRFSSLIIHNRLTFRISNQISIEHVATFSLRNRIFIASKITLSTITQRLQKSDEYSFCHHVHCKPQLTDTAQMIRWNNRCDHNGSKTHTRERERERRSTAYEYSMMAIAKIHITT